MPNGKTSAENQILNMPNGKTSAEGLCFLLLYMYIDIDIDYR